MVDERRHRSEWLWGKVLAALLALVWFSACQQLERLPNSTAVLPAWRAALPAGAQPRGLVLDAQAELPLLDPAHTLFVVDPNWRVPGRATPEAHRQALRAFVEAGGRLVLFGHAARMVHELQVEPERPENSVYRWGFDRRAMRGTAALAVHVVSGHDAVLFEGLTGTVSDHSFPVTGGAPCTVPLCAWQIGSAQKGTVLARLGEVLDGEPVPLGPPVVVRWQVGRGHVLACGVLPDLQNADPTVRGNAQRLAHQCAVWAGARNVWLAKVPDRTPPQLAVPEHGPPMVPWLAHWGWQVGLYDGEDAGSVRPPDELLRDAILPSWMSGADVVQLELGDVQHGAPLAWSKQDAIERPSSFRGQELPGAWARGGFRALADEVHTRGMLVFGGLDPLPVGDRAGERLVALRMHARELAGLRRHGSGAFDGFALRQWWTDPQGFGVAMVQDFQPAATLYASGERCPELAGSLRSVDADDGGLRGLSLTGIGDGYRDGFASDLFPLGVLDARAVPDRWTGNGVRGGGSHPDWLMRQLQSFVRDRRLAGGTALWRRHDPRNLDAATADYVHGLCLEPLRAAVATPLAATGRDGVRAAARDLLDAAPTGFGGEVDAPAAVHLLQNNWFRLLGSGGALQFDPRGLARFGNGRIESVAQPKTGDRTESAAETNVAEASYRRHDERAQPNHSAALTISDGLMRTRLFGGRPDGSELRAERHNFVMHGYRGEGGYQKHARIGSTAQSDRRTPALLGFDAAPRWPASADFEWQPSKGYHELRLRLRSERGGAMVAVSLDDVLLRCIPVKHQGRQAEVIVPVHIAKFGPRVLRVEILDGHTVAIDQLRTHRAGDVGVEAEVLAPAGSRAQLLERSSSSYHEERVTLTAMADVPGFVVHTECVSAARNLQIERRLSLPRYARVTASTEGDDSNGRRRPFVLTSTDKLVPDLCIVPLQLARYERFTFAGGELLWRGAPEAGLTARVGFLFWPHGRGHEILRHATRLVDAIDRAVSVDLGPDGCAKLVTDLPVAQSRLLHVETDIRTPFLVCERGYWTWRGSQPAIGGGVWLRIHQDPGDVVEVCAGANVLARTRPGMGSLRLLALQDPRPRSVTATVLQRSRLRAPAVIMAMDFDEVRIDGKPWAWFDGRTVFLPDLPGTYRLETLTHTGRLARSERPHVRCTGATLVQCAYDQDARELTFTTARDPDRPTGMPWTAVVQGPVPTSIDNGEIVATPTLHLPSAAAVAAAERGGVLIRFRPGKTTLRYPEWNAATGR